MHIPGFVQGVVELKLVSTFAFFDSCGSCANEPNLDSVSKNKYGYRSNYGQNWNDCRNGILL